MGVTAARGKAETTIKARVFDENGELLADLGVIVGKQTKKEKASTEKKLKMLEDRSKAKRKEEMNNG